MIKFLKRKLTKSVIKLLMNKGALTQSQGLRCWYIYNNKSVHHCGICQGKLINRFRNIDHKIPKSLGGNNDLDNLQFTHIYCNHKKGNKI